MIFFDVVHQLKTKISNNLAVTEEGFALDARQGKVLNEKIAEVDGNLSKMIQASGDVTGDDDWDSITTAGVYLVNNCNMTAANHAPVGVYRYGTLVVHIASNGVVPRISQIYYPHAISNQSQPITMATRTYEGISGWQPWYAVSGTLLE